MKKLSFALVLVLTFSSPALALLDYTELRGLWEVKGTIYRVGPGDGGPTAPIEENLVEIGQIPPTLIEIGDRDYNFGYGEWSIDEQHKAIAALEAFLSGGMTNNLNEALEQLPGVAYLFLPNIEKHDWRDLGVPIDGWFGFDWSYPKIKFPVRGDSISQVSWLICSDFSRPESWKHDHATLLFDDILDKAFVSLGLVSMVRAAAAYDMRGYFAGDNSSDLKIRFLTTYYPTGSVAETYMFYYKLSMERR